MDAKDLRTQSALGERNDDVTKYTQSGSAIQYNRNKSYQDIRSNPSSKVDTSAARPCAVIGPDRVVPPAVPTEAYMRKAPLEPWLCPDATYHHQPEYPNRTLNYQNLTRNISPRQTFQEDMQRIMVPTSYNSVKINSDNNFPQLAERNVSMSKNVKINNAADIKYCDVPYTVNQTSNNPKLRPDMGVSNVNPVLVRPAPQAWPPGSARPQRAYGAPEMYQFPDYPSCAGPRPVPISRPHRTVQEEPGHMYSDSYYQESSIRYKPYPNIKERYPQTRYDYTSNYSNPFHPPPPFLPLKYDLSKPMPPHTYPGHPHFKYTNSRIPEPVPDGYHRPISQQANYNAQFRNQIIHPTYGPVLSNFSQSKVPQYTPEGSMKSITSNKLLYDNNGKMYIDYENSHIKHPSENFYANEPSRLHAMKNQVAIPNYPPVNMQSIPAHLLYKKDLQIKHYDYMNHYKSFDPLTNLNSPVSRHLPQFSPSTIAISPTDSSTSNDTAHTQGTSLEDYGYVSQSSAASIRSMDSGVNRVSNDYHGRYYDYRYGPVMRTPFIPKSAGNHNSSVDSKDKKGINVRQFLQMWNEGDDENGENNSRKEIVVQTNSDEGAKTLKQSEVLNNQEQLYVLGLVNVPSDELSKYEHIQKISKLPENIKGYNSIELLTQFEEVIESSNINSFKSSVNKEFQNSFKNSVPKQAMGILPRPVSPLDVEAKISQSVIHKEVGCNFEIKPCSPKMSNVAPELTAPVRNHLDERIIEKVTNPHSNMIKPPISNRIDEVLESCKIMNRQDQRIHNETDKISSCEMINTQYSHNSSIKTNYSLHDLESNSGLSLASLPRLDNEIELNFPEVNQQFINANKGDSTVTKTKDLPNVEMGDQISLKTPKGTLKLEVEIKNRMSPSITSDKEFTKLSKYRKIKMSDGDTKGDNIVQKAFRTDSVIIKNPENTKNVDDLNVYSPIHHLLDESQQGPINLTSQSDMKTESGFEIEKPNADGGVCNDTAIDFSINKSDDITNVSSKQPVQKNGANIIEKVSIHTKNQENYSFAKCTDMTSNIDLQHMNDSTNTEFVKDKKTSKNVPTNFNGSEVMSPINEKATSEMGGQVNITNFKDVSNVQLSKNADIPIDSINHEPLTDLVGKVNISSPISDSSFINVHTQGSCAMEIDESDKSILTDVLPCFENNMLSQVETYSQEKEHTKLDNILELNKSEINKSICVDNNIEKQCTEMHDNDEEIIEDKKVYHSKGEVNGTEVHNNNCNKRNLHYESDDKREISDSGFNIKNTVIFPDTNSFTIEQVPTSNKNINDPCNTLVVNHIVPSREARTDCDVSRSENLRDDKIDSSKQIIGCNDKISRHSIENCSKKVGTFDNYQIIPDAYVKVNKSSITSFKKHLCSFSKKLYSPLIQNLIMFSEGMCELPLPNIKLQSDILKNTVFTNHFDTYSSANIDGNIKKICETEANIEELPLSVPGEDIFFSNTAVRYNEEMHDTVPNSNNESNVKEKLMLKSKNNINTNFSNNYKISFNNGCETESSVEVLRRDILAGDCNLSNNSEKYDEVKGDPLLVSENIKSCMIKDKRAMRLSDEYDVDYSVKNNTDISTSCETVINIDSLPSSALSDDHSFSNETGMFDENLHGPLLLNQTDDNSIQENVSTFSTNQFESESSLIINKNERDSRDRNSIETKAIFEEPHLGTSDGDRDLFSKPIMCNEPKCGPSILNEKYKSGKTKNIISVKLGDQFITDTFVDNNKNVIGCKGTEATVLDPSHLDDNHKLFSNATKCNDVICDSLFLNESNESGNAIEKVQDHIVTDSQSGDDQNEKECNDNEKCDKETQPNVIDSDGIYPCDNNIEINSNKYSNDEVTLISKNENKCISREVNNVEYDKTNEPVIQQKIPYINEFYDEIEDSDESTSTHFEFASTAITKKSFNNPNLDSREQITEPIINNITNQNDSSIDFKDTNAVQDTIEQSDINRNDNDSIAKCENEDTKITKRINCEYSSTSRFSLKRSLSDSALNSLHDNMQEGNDNLAYLWPLKRKKTNNIANPVEPNLIAQNLCSILQSNRRNSISSIYNEESVSFCILIDNNCIITEGNEDEKICYTDLSEECEIEHNCANEENSDMAEEGQLCSDPENCEYSDSLNMECDHEKSVEDSWVEDVACVETVISDDIAEDVMISTSSSPKDISLSEGEESNIFSCNIGEHTDKVKYIYGEGMCNDDAQFVETLYNTPQMDVNKTLSTRESQVLEECHRIYDNESLEKILSGSNSRGASPYNSEEPTGSLYSAIAFNCNKTPDDKENIYIDNKSPLQSVEHYANTVNIMGNNKVDPENNHLKVNEKTQDDTVHSCESSMDNVFSYKQIDDSIFYTPSCSPEVSSTTSEEKNTGILLKITNYKGSIISEINGIKSDNNRPRCKFTEKKDYSNSKLSSHRPLITKAAQKYIPPLKESIRDLKVKISLPEHSLLKFKQLKVSKDEPKLHKHYSASPRVPKKPKPKFEDVLMNIDKVQFKMHKEKNKKGKKSIPKVVIKKTENGSHYASTSDKDTYNPDLTGRKWQPWVFLEKNNFIDKMANRGKTKAVYSHRKNTYVLAEKFYKYKSVNSTKFVISQPKCSDSSTGQLKYTIRLKHNY